MYFLIDNYIQNSWPRAPEKSIYLINYHDLRQTFNFHLLPVHGKFMYPWKICALRQLLLLAIS